jgi:glyoxylase I family protein
MPIVTEYLCPLIQVFDMPTSLRFYRDIVGFKIVNHSGGDDDRYDWVELKLGNASLMLNTAYEQHERPVKPDAARVAAHADTCLFIGCPDVDGAYRYLRDRGVDVKEPEIAWYGMKQLTVVDPDGYGVCFQWPAPSGSVAK